MLRKRSEQTTTIRVRLSDKAIFDELCKVRDAYAVDLVGHLIQNAYRWSKKKKAS